ncbi:hypothetical protein MG293_000865 [Ovis ammon polii]|uniref:Uncharacterized protein n=1 Tax=Ovis ammon polii TaxID=230172 RepID=A0AAD4UQF9_OVIAM|nr:hypothetical protein MG293_000865 [Ovis ammon polii]
MATHSSYSCLENSMERGPWWATAHGITKLIFSSILLSSTPTPQFLLHCTDVIFSGTAVNVMQPRFPQILVLMFAHLMKKSPFPDYEFVFVGCGQGVPGWELVGTLVVVMALVSDVQMPVEQL